MKIIFSRLECVFQKHIWGGGAGRFSAESILYNPIKQILYNPIKTNQKGYLRLNKYGSALNTFFFN